MIIEKSIQTQGKEAFIEITSLVRHEVESSGIREGSVIVFVPHTTAGVTINENADPDVKKDLISGLASLNFEDLPFLHAEGNSPSHLKATLVGSSVQVPFSGGRLFLGHWQGIFFCEFDGPRKRKVLIQILG